MKMNKFCFVIILFLFYSCSLDDGKERKIKIYSFFRNNEDSVFTKNRIYIITFKSNGKIDSIQWFSYQSKDKFFDKSEFIKTLNSSDLNFYETEKYYFDTCFYVLDRHFARKICSQLLLNEFVGIHPIFTHTNPETIFRFYNNVNDNRKEFTVQKLTAASDNSLKFCIENKPHPLPKKNTIAYYITKYYSIKEIYKIDSTIIEVDRFKRITLVKEFYNMNEKYNVISYNYDKSGNLNMVREICKDNSEKENYFEVLYKIW